MGKRLVDPINDSITFLKVDHGFVMKGEKIYKKARTHRHCGEAFIDIYYYQNVSRSIELSSYREYDQRFFRTKNGVYFWWSNSGGHLIIPVEGADPETFQPFEDICGGADTNGVYYGSPNYGVYRLNIAQNSAYEFIAKENNYWNSPDHYLIIDDRVYDIKYEYERGYFCKLNDTLSKEEISTRDK